MPGLNPHIFEMAMLLCFGCSWPFAIAKTIRSKKVEGKSIVFVILVFIGYLSGIISKVIGDFDHVIWLYAFNGSLVFTEMVLYFKYKRSSVRRILQILRPKPAVPSPHEKTLWVFPTRNIGQSIAKGASQ